LAHHLGGSGLSEQRDAEQVAQVVAIARGVFGEYLLGAYLHGSAVLGGMLPTSDVDVLAVIGRATNAEDRAALIQRIMPISGPPVAESRWRPVELTVVRQADVKPWRYPPRMQFMYGEWLKADYKRGELGPEPGPNPDLTTLLRLVLLGNYPLWGPRPAALLDAIPDADFRHGLVDGLADWTGEDQVENDTRNMLLALARTWQTLATGQIARKDAAASWAAERLPPPEAAILRRAGAQYLAGTHGEEEWPERLTDVRAAAAMMLSEIKEAARER
jgi:streptomycin 3"-adenylyltransferase